MNATKATLIITTLMLVLTAVSANAAMITPAADTYVNNGSRDADYGANETLSICNDGGSAMPKSKDRFALIRFDISAETGPFTAASLTLTQTSADLGDYILYGIPNNGADENFSESITFNTCAYTKTANDGENIYDGSLDATNLTSLGTATTDSGTLTFDAAALTDFLNADTNDIVSFIVFRTTQSGTYSYFASSEAASGAPVLNVVPEPASMALLGLGGIGLLVRRRRG